MKIDQLLRSDTVAETRAAAFAGDVPVALFAHSWLEPTRARLGDIASARIRAHDAREGGLFLELDSGEAAFMRGTMPPGLSDGSAVRVRVLSERREDKLARVAVTNDAAPSADPIEAWRERLPLSESLTWEACDADIDAAFDSAHTDIAPLPGGGHLHIARTPALTAIDVDTAGRKDRLGSKAINLDAAREAARQLALRNLGGLVVLDCIAPLPRALGADIKTAFLDRFRSISRRKAEALAPSPFGLLEARLAWGERPIAELYDSAIGTLLSGLRQLEREAKARPADTLVLALPREAYRELGERKPALLTALSERYGARLRIEPGERNTPEVTSP